MKVEVNKHRRPGVKVSVTLARAKRRGSCISIPVKVTAKNENSVESGITEEIVQRIENSIGFVPCDAEETVEPTGFCDPSEDFSSEDYAEVQPDPAAEEIFEDAPDEEDLLALIAEEEAEMASQLLHQSNAAFSEANDFSVDEPVDAPAEEPVDAPENEHHPQVEQYVRYFDRSTDGEKFEVTDTRANGQEIICVDGESGRLSRVCGFIKNNQSAQPAEDEESSVQE